MKRTISNSPVSKRGVTVARKSAGVASRYLTSPLAREMTVEKWMTEEALISEQMRSGKPDRNKSVVEVMRDIRSHASGHWVL